MWGCSLHHDGGEEDHIARLDHTLAAADLVICQTGGISHDAYWRVKDHCDLACPWATPARPACVLSCKAQLEAKG